MNLIDVKDGGLVHNEKYGVTVGVINLVVTRGDSYPEIMQGLCNPEDKENYIHRLKKQLV